MLSIAQVAKDASSKRDGTAKPSLLANQPATSDKFKTIEAAKGGSAVERARKRRAVQQSEAAADKTAMDLINDVLEGQ